MLRSMILSGALLALTAGPQFAQLVDNREPKMRCDDSQNNHDGKVQHCEIREQTLTASGATINVDALENGGVSISGWDRPDVLIRSRIQTNAVTADLAT